MYAEDVIKFVEVLPIPIDYDEDNDKNNHSITIDVAYTSFSDTTSRLMGLDFYTTVDVGDYLVLFSGSEGELNENSIMEGYGRVTSVKKISGAYIIEYEDVTEEEVMASMDLYNTRNADIDLTEEEIRKMEEDIKQQAKASGFLDDAAEYLVALALETDGYKELDDDFDLDLESYNIKLADSSTEEDINSLQLMGATASLKKEDTDIYVNIKPGKLNHYKGQNGLSVELGMKIVVEFKSDKLKTGHLELEIEACFLEEVLLNVNISGGAVWKTAWIFPYIADYQATANIDLGSFTSVGITATLKTVEDDDDDDDDKKDDDDKNKKDDKKDDIIGNQWEKLGVDKLDKNSNESVGKFIANIGNQMTELATKKGFMGGAFSGDGDEEEGDTLSSKYAEFIKESSDSWIPIVKKEIFNVEGGIDPLHILAFSISADFVVSANLYITMGAKFEVGEAKRYTYNISVKEKKVTSTETDLEKQNLTFEFYVFGTAGIKVGIELELAVGLLSTKLDSVGITAEAGAYAQLWGYFYFKYSEWINDAGVKEKEKYCSGALYFELGFYLEIKFKAQLFSSDKLTYEPTLYENQWPLLTVGDKHNVTGFADTPGAGEYYLPVEIVGKRSYGFTKSLFDMDYLDLKEGTTGVGNYNDGGESHYDISFTNKKFSYNPLNNVVSINVPEGESIKEETEMKIVWTGNALAFTTKPIEKTVKIIWSDPANARMIHFDSKGGVEVKTIALAIGDTVTVPADPTKQGYIFGGWYTDESCSQKFVFPAKMPDYENKSITVYAKWIPRKDTPYTVEHYIRNSSGRYVYDSTDYRTGETDSVPAVGELLKNREDIFYFDSAVHSISPDGQSVIKIYYKVKSYDVTFTYGNLEIRNENEIAEETMPLKYSVCHGSLQHAPIIVMPGYIFMGYKDVATGKPLETDEDGNFIVTASGTYAAEWKPAEDTPYEIDFYVKNPITYVDELVEKLYFEGTTGSAISIDDADYTLKYTDQTYYDRTWVDFNGDYETPVISAFGDTVIKFHYNKKEYNLVYMNESFKHTNTLAWGTMVSEPERPVHLRDGYYFDGWYTDSSYSEGSLVDFNNFIMPAENVTLYAKWLPRDDIKYTVEHYLQYADANGYYLDKREQLRGTVDTYVEAKYLAYEHFEANKYAKDTNSWDRIECDGSTVFRLYYDRKNVKVKLNAGVGTNGESAYFEVNGENKPSIELTFRYGQKFQSSDFPKLEFYVFGGWKDESGNYFDTGKLLEQSDTVELTADWIYHATEFSVRHYIMDKEGKYPETPIMEIKAVSEPESYPLADFVNTNYFEGGGLKFVYAKIGENIESSEPLTEGNINIESGLVLNLFYERNKFSISYTMAEDRYSSVLDGQEYTNGMVYFGTEIKKPNLEQEGMTVSVQVAENVYYNEINTMPASDLTCTVSYAYNQYYVYFSTNRYPQQFEYGTAQKLAENEYKRTGYTFLGWTKKNGSSLVDYSDRQEVKNLTQEPDGCIYLYPVWKPITINIEVRLIGEDDLGKQWYIPDKLVSDRSMLKNLTVTYDYYAFSNYLNDLPDMSNLNVTGYKFSKWRTGDILEDSPQKGWLYVNTDVSGHYIEFEELKDGDTIYLSAVFEVIEYKLHWDEGVGGYVSRPSSFRFFPWIDITCFDNSVKDAHGFDYNFMTDYVFWGDYKTIDKWYRYDGWYTKPNGQGYKLVDGHLEKDGKRYDPVDFPKDLTIENDIMTLYANWVECGDVAYTVTVHRPYRYIKTVEGQFPNHTNATTFGTNGYETMYHTANIPADILSAPEGGTIKGWLVYDDNNQPIYDQQGNQYYWDGVNGFKDTMVDGKYGNINLYPNGTASW